jgi:hypothetical protein
MKLLNLLKEIYLNEAKQVGDIYHFTPLYSCLEILKSQYIQPNDENQISTSRYANSPTGFITHGDDKIICRIMMDGNKISTKYKIKGYTHPDDVDLAYGDDKKLDYQIKADFLKRKGAKGKYAEEAIETKGEKFYLLPYVKRIDIFIENNLNKKEQKPLETLIKLLDKMNIPYKAYQGTPKSNIPYKQSKEGDPSQMQYKPLPKEIKVSNHEYRHPYPKYEMYTFSPNQNTYQLPPQPKELTNKKQFITYPDLLSQNWDLTPEFPDYYVTPSTKFSFNYDKDLSNSDPEKQAYGDKYSFGEDYSNPITQKIINSLKFKTWDELDLQYRIENIDKKLKKYFDKPEGLIMLSKSIAEKYLIPSKTTIDPELTSRSVIPEQ